MHKDTLLSFTIQKPTHFTFHSTQKYIMDDYSFLILSGWCVCMINEPISKQECICLMTSWNYLDATEIYCKNRKLSKKFTSNLSVSIRKQKKYNGWMKDGNKQSQKLLVDTRKFVFKYSSVFNAFVLWREKKKPTTNNSPGFIKFTHNLIY